MEVLIFENDAIASRYAARVFAKLIHNKPDAVLGLATGSTPCLLYAELRRQHEQEGLDFSGITSFNLDEYVGLNPEHPSSYRYFMKQALFDHVNVKPDRVNLPDGQSDDVPATCADYEKSISAAGGIDLQVLGLGSDCHIGFNEPSSSLASRTRIKTLTRGTREDNARFFDSVDAVPRHCITMGIGTIMEARQIVLCWLSGTARLQQCSRSSKGRFRQCVRQQSCRCIRPLSCCLTRQLQPVSIKRNITGKLQTTSRTGKKSRKL